MKVFVTGAAGQLGTDVMTELQRRGHQAIGSDVLEAQGLLALDITDEQAVMRVLQAERPDAVIHCAAWTAVDAAEEPENRAMVCMPSMRWARAIWPLPVKRWAASCST